MGKYQKFLSCELWQNIVGELLLIEPKASTRPCRTLSSPSGKSERSAILPETRTCCSSLWCCDHTRGQYQHDNTSEYSRLELFINKIERLCWMLYCTGTVQISCQNIGIWLPFGRLFSIHISFAPNATFIKSSFDDGAFDTSYLSVSFDCLRWAGSGVTSARSRNRFQYIFSM